MSGVPPALLVSGFTGEAKVIEMLATICLEWEAIKKHKSSLTQRSDFKLHFFDTQPCLLIQLFFSHCSPLVFSDFPYDWKKKESKSLNVRTNNRLLSGDVPSRGAPYDNTRRGSAQSFPSRPLSSRNTRSSSEPYRQLPVLDTMFPPWRHSTATRDNQARPIFGQGTIRRALDPSLAIVALQSSRFDDGGRRLRM